MGHHRATIGLRHIWVMTIAKYFVDKDQAEARG